MIYHGGSSHWILLPYAVHICRSCAAMHMARQLRELGLGGPSWNLLDLNLPSNVYTQANLYHSVGRYYLGLNPHWRTCRYLLCGCSDGHHIVVVCYWMPDPWHLHSRCRNAPVGTPGTRCLGGLTARVEYEYTAEPLSQPAVLRVTSGAALEWSTMPTYHSYLELLS